MAFVKPSKIISLRLDTDEQQSHPCPNHRLLERPIIRCAPTHPTRRGDAELPLPWFPCCCWLVWYSARRAASVDIERGSLCPENRSSVVRGGSATCSVVRYAFRLVTAANRALLLLSSGGGGVSVFSLSLSVFVNVSPVIFCFSALSATARLSGLGVIPVEK